MQVCPQSDVNAQYSKENAYKNVTMIWGHDQTVRLIRAFRKHDILWNCTSKCYRDRRKKARAWADVETEIGTPVDMCKRRVESLLASCRREKNKIRRSKATDPPDEVYEPKWSYWRELRFLHGLTEENPESAVEVDPLLTEPSDPNEPRWSPSARRPPRKRRKKTDPPPKADEPRVPAEPRRGEDEHDAYGITVAAKLRRMEDGQRLYAENIINQALYKGLTFQLTPISESEMFPNPRLQQQPEHHHQQQQQQQQQQEPQQWQSFNHAHAASYSQKPSSVPHRTDRPDAGEDFKQIDLI